MAITIIYCACHTVLDIILCSKRKTDQTNTAPSTHRNIALKGVVRRRHVLSEDQTPISCSQTFVSIHETEAGRKSWPGKSDP